MYNINMKNIFTFVLAGLLSGCYIIVDDAYTDTTAGSYNAYSDHVWIDHADVYCTHQYGYYTDSSVWEFYASVDSMGGYNNIYSVQINIYEYYGYDAWTYYLYANGQGQYSYQFTSTSIDCNNIYDIEFVTEDNDGNFASEWVVW